MVGFCFIFLLRANVETSLEPVGFVSSAALESFGLSVGMLLLDNNTALPHLKDEGTKKPDWNEDINATTRLTHPFLSTLQ